MAGVWMTADRIFVRLSSKERAVLSQLPVLVGGVGIEENDPAYGRMSPNAYADDVEAAQEFTSMTAGDLDAARRRDAEVFAETLDAIGDTGMTLEEAEAWVRMIGDSRLVLAARAGVDHDSGLPEPSATDPRIALVHYLGALQNDVVEALLSTMADA
jgi:hypothetical protein